MKDSLDKLKAEIAALAKADPDDSEAVEMTPEQFTEHLTGEIAKFKKSAGAERAARKTYLDTIIDLAKNYEGPTPNAMAIPMFKDAAQSSHTSGPMATGDQPMGTNFSQEASLPPAGTPTPPSAGGMPPTEAGSSGAPFAGGNFAKAIDTKLDELKALVAKATETAPAAPETPAAAPATDAAPVVKADDKPTETPAAAADTKTDAKPAESAPVTKSASDGWPLDMNSKVGLGKSESADLPENFFGWDSGSELETESKTAE